MHILSATDTPVCGNYSAADLSRTGAKVYAAPSHGKAAPAGTSVSGQSPLSAARNEKIVSSPAAPAIAVDGDSLEIGSRRIRLMGIDAPEYDQFCKRTMGNFIHADNWQLIISKR